MSKCIDICPLLCNPDIVVEPLNNRLIFRRRFYNNGQFVQRYTSLHIQDDRILATNGLNISPEIIACTGMADLHQFALVLRKNSSCSQFVFCHVLSKDIWGTGGSS